MPTASGRSTNSSSKSRRFDTGRRLHGPLEVERLEGLEVWYLLTGNERVGHRVLVVVDTDRDPVVDTQFVQWLVAGDAERRITPALVEAIARRTRDDDVDTYVDRHGLDGLAVALEYAREYVDGSVTHQIMAREQEISPLEAGVILDALRPVVED